ncbi:MAG: hypothetical protein DRJ63_09270 [Thermoprotei archaeon]|nr:MAG: hypothetical protein DRJ63_09270 [Thermoprotei archaeon]
MNKCFKETRSILKVSNRAYPWLLALSFLYYFINALWQTLLPLYIDSKGFEAWEVGFSVVLVMNLPWVVAVVAGLIAEKLEWRISVTLSALVLSAVLFSLVYVSTFYELIAFLTAASFSIALFAQASMEIIAESKIEEKLGLAFASYYTVSGIAKTLGSLTAGIMVSYWNYSVLYFTASICALGLALLSYRKFPGTRRVEKPLSFMKFAKTLFSSKSFMLLAATVVVHDFSVFISASYTALFAKKVVGLNELEYSILVSVRNLVYILSQPLSGLLVDKIGGIPVLATHFIFVTISYVSYGLTTGFWDLLAVHIFMGISLTLDLPARRKLVSKIAPEHKIAASSGLIDTLVGLGTLPSPLIGGEIWTKISPRPTLITGGLANTTALIPLLLLKKNMKEKIK